VFSKALAKAPDDRYDSCAEFADALAKQLGIVAAETGATEATAVALPASGPRHRAQQQRAVNQPPKIDLKIVVAILATLLVVVTVAALVLFVLHVM
jgi:serine/threonine-protein kinase